MESVVVAPPSARAEEQGGFGPLERLAVAYLALPLPIFFLTWLQPLYGLPLTALLLLALRGLVRPGGGGWPAGPLLVTTALVAAAWSSLGGAGHLFYANAYDWIARDAVLRDLVTMPAPVTYDQVDGLPLILRAPIAYYLPAALLAKGLGLAWADTLLLLWTGLGAWLFLAMVAAQVKAASWRGAAAVAALVVLFSGMDVLGNPGMALDPTFHREWWAGMAQYSSNSTLLFWVPNHALPGWLLTMVLLRARHDPAYLRIAGVIGALGLLWAPLVCIGLAPLLLALAVLRLREGRLRTLLTAENLLAAPLLAAVPALYLTMDSARIPLQVLPAQLPLGLFLPLYLFFVIVEGGAQCLAARLAHPPGRPVFLWTALVVLALLPVVSFGPGNDLAMRGSIPALVVIMVACLEALLAQPAGAPMPRRALPLLLMLTIGMMTPANEIARALLLPRWSPNVTDSLYRLTEGNTQPHYFARLTDARVAQVLRPIPGHGVVADAAATQAVKPQN